MTKSKAQIDATNRYMRKNYDSLMLNVRKDAELNGDAIRNHAKSMGESINGFIMRAVNEAIARDKEKSELTEYKKMR